MTRFAFSCTLVLLCGWVARVYCLSSISGSPCYDTCNGDHATSSGDVVCLDDDFQNSTKGKVFGSCLTCLRTSTFGSGPMTDPILYLYYLSSVQQTCLSGAPGPPISSCSSNCGNISSAFSSIGGRGFFQSPYSYCETNNNVYESSAPGCAKCLRGQEGTVILGNFISVGNSACNAQPDLRNGAGSIPGSEQIFDATLLIDTNSTDSAHVATITASSPSNSSKSTNSVASSAVATGSEVARASSSSSGKVSGTATSSSNENERSGGGLSRGAAAAIGLVLGMLGVGGIILFAILARRRMQRKQSTNSTPGPWTKMRDSPEMRQTPGTASAHGAIPIPPTPGDAMSSPVAVPKKSKSFKSIRSLKNLTPRTSEWFYAANPKQSTEVTALPQRGWD